MTHSTLNNLRSIGLRLVAGTLLCVTASAASAEIVMRAASISTGSSTLQGFTAAKGWLQVDAFGFDVDRATMRSSGKAGTSDLNLGIADKPTVTVIRPVDNATPLLLLDAISGTNIGKVEVEFVTVSEAKAGTESLARSYLSFVLDNVAVKSHRITAEDGETYESMELVFSAFTVTHHGDAAGPVTPVSTGWDTVEQKAKK